MSQTGLKGASIPQARSLDTIRQVVLCASSGPVDNETLVEKTELSLRHVGYHLLAATTLGWLRPEESVFVLTEEGRRLLDTSPHSHEEAVEFATAIAHSPVIRQVAPELADLRVSPDTKKITRAIQNASGLALSTAEARAQTLVAWRRRIEKALHTDAQLNLPLDGALDVSPTLVQVTMQDWMSFESAVLDIEPLTILIGANASGKSNALDALVLLQRLAVGDDIRAALTGGPTFDPMRGGVEWAARCGSTRFTLSALVASTDGKYDYRYSVSIETQPQVLLFAESLERKARQGVAKSGIGLFRTDVAGQSTPSLTVRLYNAKAGTKREVGRSVTVLKQLAGAKLRREIQDGILAVQTCLKGILVLDPVPSRMRGYSTLSEVLKPDGSNAAGVLAALEPELKARTERVLSTYAKKLPERGVEAIWTEKVGKFSADAMLYARERWVNDANDIEIDSRGMSDGTLRFIAILTALLIRPPGSTLVIEEIDNGFHPARTSLLLDTLKTLGVKRQVDVIVTTHNKALLDAVDPDLVRAVVVAHRQTQSGASTLTVLDDLKELPRLLSGGRLGEAVATGRLGAFLKARGANEA